MFFVIGIGIVTTALFWHQGIGISFPSFVIREVHRGDVLFLGDVMLSRYVEKHMRESGMSYPFSSVAETLSGYNHVVGNLEGTVPKDHVPTPVQGFSFSIDSTFIPVLKDAGFTMMTLANNHALDFGNDAYLHTKEVLRHNDLAAAGHPTTFGTSQSEVISVGGIRVAIIPVHAVDRGVDAEHMKRSMDSLSGLSEFQIVVIHWGEEYQTVANERQRTLAHAFIDAGADVIIGHHPHVVQNIEMYKDAPIFYSLGNFVFDQYFSEDVEQGLAVAMTVRGTVIEYGLMPIQSAASMPRFLEGEEKERFLAKLAESSDPRIAPDIRLGSIVVTASLASLDSEAMMIGH